MQSVAQQVVVYQLTNSELALGLVACAQGLPSLLLTPFAGVIVEQVPRRRILVMTQSLMMILAFILAALQFAGLTQVWHIVVLSLGLGVANALDAPARQAFVVEMVGREQLTSGIVLNAIMFNTGRVIGPALGGIALVQVGPAWCFLLNGASFIAVIASLLLMEVVSIKHAVQNMAFWDTLKEGLAFVSTHHSIRPLLLLSAMNSVFGLTFAVLLPAFADQVLHSPVNGTAALLTAEGIGAVLAGIVVAQANNRGRRGTILFICAILGPLSMILFAVNSSNVPALILAGCAGLFMICQFILMNTLIQVVVPNEFRGRVMSLYTLTFFGLTPFSSLAIGVLAQNLGTPPAILLYGCACLIGSGFLFWRFPQLRQMV